MKALIKRLLPGRLLEIIRLFKTHKDEAKIVELSQIDILRKEPKDRLIDPYYLELNLLPRLGFNDEELGEFPEELYPYCGKGLRSWQYPNQFSRYLVLLSTLRIGSYLEIGVRHGGTFIITVEYLKRFNILEKMIGIDLISNPSLANYCRLNNKVNYYQMSSKSKEFEHMVAMEGPFDLVLVDGNHEESAVRQDVATVCEQAHILVLHDINSDVCPGVGRVWRELRNLRGDEYRFWEFIDQYESVRKRTNKNFLGIGVAAKQEYLHTKYRIE